jgi:hypothetical protein
MGEMSSIHIVCKASPDGGHINLSVIDATHCKSGCWYFLPSMTPRLDELKDGWIYLHEKRDQPSYTGGVIRKIEPCPKKSGSQGWAFTFEVRPDGKGQEWRGLDNARAIHGWIVTSDLPHEKNDAPRS